MSYIVLYEMAKRGMWTCEF